MIQVESPVAHSFVDAYLAAPMPALVRLCVNGTFDIAGVLAGLYALVCIEMNVAGCIKILHCSKRPVIRCIAICETYTPTVNTGTFRGNEYVARPGITRGAPNRVRTGGAYLHAANLGTISTIVPRPELQRPRSSESLPTKRSNVSRRWYNVVPTHSPRWNHARAHAFCVIILATWRRITIPRSSSDAEGH